MPLVRSRRMSSSAGASGLVAGAPSRSTNRLRREASHMVRAPFSDAYMDLELMIFTHICSFSLNTCDNYGLSTIVCRLTCCPIVLPLRPPPTTRSCVPISVYLPALGEYHHTLAVLLYALSDRAGAAATTVICRPADHWLPPIRPPPFIGTTAPSSSTPPHHRHHRSILPRPTPN